MTVERLLPTPEAYDLIDLTRQICAEQIAPRVATDEATEHFPRDHFALLGKAGLLGLPYPEEYGGGAQPYEVYLQVLEEIASVSMSIGVGTSVHSLATSAVAKHGTPEQQASLLPGVLGGEMLGAYCLSEPQAGSDVAGMTTKAVLDGDAYVLNGVKAWITHGSRADFYLAFVRTAPDRTSGISAFYVPADTEGLSFGAPEKKMGLTASTTTQVLFDDARVPAELRIGEEGEGMRIALGALDSGRLGIAACATGLAQAALDAATQYAGERSQFGRAIGDFQGLQFLLADMAAATESARAAYVLAARLRDAGRPFSRQASVAKLVATDAAMQVTTDAVQVFGGYGYTREFPVERYMREAKVAQIFEGTNQIQRMVIARDLLR
ncbi:acyl-CoA dehydrogenase family protein [Solicola gregarius]|uniref:Acyl-CoA dehydrogenase family protein n=1 Tax=Solicola gregarius TaxID=2908642 RepID=A0AA46TKZ6_9ACTN|nr:acyl-CoA dehydrogenase family protein [Solicola gregarius]UYM06844.1 acyl-CoA dehydrogenase family protein [Solicola gregarius]